MLSYFPYSKNNGQQKIKNKIKMVGKKKQNISDIQTISATKPGAKSGICRESRDKCVAIGGRFNTRKQTTKSPKKYRIPNKIVAIQNETKTTTA